MGGYVSVVEHYSGAIVKQGTNTGVLKSNFTGASTSLIITANPGSIFVTNLDIIINTPEFGETTEFETTIAHTKEDVPQLFITSNLCKLCPKGTWENRTGMTECTSCVEGRFSMYEAQLTPDTCLDCGRKARCCDSVCCPNFDPETRCTACLRPKRPPFYFGKNCTQCTDWLVPGNSPLQSYITDGLLCSVGVYFLFALLYIVFRTDSSKIKPVQVAPSLKNADDEDKHIDDITIDEIGDKKNPIEVDELKQLYKEKLSALPNMKKQEEKKEEESKKEGEDEEKEPEMTLEEMEKKADPTILYTYQKELKEKLKELDDFADTNEEELAFQKKIEEEEKQWAKDHDKSSEDDVGFNSKIGTAMPRIIIMQMQLVSAILPAIAWSDCLPIFVTDLLDFLAAIFAIDIGELITSPECGNVNTSVRQRWLLRSMMPLGLVSLLIFWALCIKCWLARKKQARHNALLTILRIAVKVQLLGMTKTAVLTSLKILSCETLENGDSVLAMDQKPCPINGGPDMGLAIMGILFVVLYGVIPYTAIAVKLCKNGKPGKLDENFKPTKYDTNSAGFITYGWAAMGHREGAYLWECYNAMIIIVFLSGSELMEGEARAFFHAAVAFFSLIMHAVVKPYEDKSGNFIVSLFSFVIIIGALAEVEFNSGNVLPLFPGGRSTCEAAALRKEEIANSDADIGVFEQTSSNSQLELQWTFFGLLLFALLMSAWFGMTAAVNMVKRKHAILEKKQNEKKSNDSDDIDSEKKRKHGKLDCCERMMLMPFLLLVGLPSIVLCLPLAILSSIFWPFIQVWRFGQHATEVVEIIAIFNFLFKIFRFVFTLLLWPIYVICFVSAHTQFLGVVDSVGLGRCLEWLGKKVYKIMFPVYQEDIEDEIEIFNCDHPLCKFSTEEKLAIMRHHRTCEFARPFKCRECGFRAAEDHIRVHELEVHSVDKVRLISAPDMGLGPGNGTMNLDSDDESMLDDAFGEIHEISIVDSDDSDEEKKKKNKKKKKKKKKKNTTSQRRRRRHVW